MHIVHLTASALYGGPERQMLGLASALSGGHTTSFLSFSEGGRCQSFLTAARTSGFDAAELRHDTPNLTSAIREAAAFLRGNFADVLITHGYKSNLIGRLAARQTGIPIVSVSRGWTGENFKVSCYEAVDRFHLRFMDRVVCVSAGQAQRVVRAGVAPARVRVIRNSARMSAFRRPEVAGRDVLTSLAGGDGPVVLAAGRLSPEKGFHVLLQSTRAILQEVPAARFVLFGEGPERSPLEATIARLGIADRFRVVGFRSDLDAMIPWADVVALPSFTEGLPNVALEASAAGVPVVATAVGGTPEVVVNGQTGFLVEPGDAMSLATGIIYLLRHPEQARRMGAAARQRMHDCFSFESQAQAYEALFTELVTSPLRAQSVRSLACA